MVKLPRYVRVAVVCGLSGRPVGLICDRCSFRGVVPFRLLDVKSDDDPRPLYDLVGQCPECQDRDQVALYAFLSQAGFDEYQKSLPPRPTLQSHSTP